MFRTPSGKPASIANSARIIEAPKMEKNKNKDEKYRKINP